MVGAERNNSDFSTLHGFIEQEQRAEKINRKISEKTILDNFVSKFECYTTEMEERGREGSVENNLTVEINLSVDAKFEKLPVKGSEGESRGRAVSQKTEIEQDLVIIEEYHGESNKGREIAGKVEDEEDEEEEDIDGTEDSTKKAKFRSAVRVRGSGGDGSGSAGGSLNGSQKSGDKKTKEAEKEEELLNEKKREIEREEKKTAARLVRSQFLVDMEAHFKIVKARKILRESKPMIKTTTVTTVHTETMGSVATKRTTTTVTETQTTEIVPNPSIVCVPGYIESIEIDFSSLPSTRVSQSAHFCRLNIDVSLFLFFVTRLVLQSITPYLPSQPPSFFTLSYSYPSSLALRQSLAQSHVFTHFLRQTFTRSHTHTLTDSSTYSPNQSVTHILFLSLTPPLRTGPQPFYSPV